MRKSITDPFSNCFNSLLIKSGSAALAEAEATFSAEACNILESL